MDDSSDPDDGSRTERFLLDAMLGSLATYLRMCGYDAAYALDRGIENDDRLQEVAHGEDRRLLTRDVDLAARTPGGLLVESRTIEGQLRELSAAGYDLSLASKPTRCGSCNGRLRQVGEDEDTPEHAPDPGEQSVWRCDRCGQHFWRGSHWADVEKRLGSL